MIGAGKMHLTFFAGELILYGQKASPESAGIAGMKSRQDS
jgi:hypothetical protein